MDVISLDLSEVKSIHPRVFEDERGYFLETYTREKFAAAGVVDFFVQDNQSGSKRMGTVRGLHFQLPPFAQAKLVRVLRGSIYDVVVDIRKGSPSFGRHVGIVLSAENRIQLYVPEGFAHGFCSLEPETEVSYKVSAPYSPAHDRGIFWNDPDLGIDWPVSPGHVVLSAKDSALPRLASCEGLFAFKDAKVA